MREVFTVRKLWDLSAVFPWAEEYKELSQAKRQTGSGQELTRWSTHCLGWMVFLLWEVGRGCRRCSSTSFGSFSWQQWRREGSCHSLQKTMRLWWWTGKEKKCLYSLMGDSVLTLFLQKWPLCLYVSLDFMNLHLASALCLLKLAREGVNVYRMEMAVKFSGCPRQAFSYFVLFLEYRQQAQMSPLLFASWSTKFYASLCLCPTKVVWKCTCMYMFSCLLNFLQIVKGSWFNLYFVLYHSAHHFSPGTQCITSTLCWALPAGIAPRHVATGCPFPQPKPLATTSSGNPPFLHGRLFNSQLSPLPLLDATNALQPSALCNLVKPRSCWAHVIPCPGLDPPGGPPHQCTPRAALCVGALSSRGAQLTWMPGLGLKLLCLPNAATSGASASSPAGNGDPRGLHLLSGPVVPRTRCRAEPCHATVPPCSPPPFPSPHAVPSSNHFKAKIETDQMRGWRLPPRVVPPTGK